MKKITLMTLLWICMLIANATEQMPDYLIYNGQKLSLSTGWGHPSPLQTYFSQNGIKSPFRISSTANYRGHVATWEISDNKFFLKEIKAEGDVYSPEKYNIRSQSDSINKDGMVFADWFTGVLNCYEGRDAKESYFFYVRYGEVIDSQIITQNDYEKIGNISEKDTTNHELMEKYRILVLNENYISYYFRLSLDNDLITVGDERGQFMGKSGNSPLLEYFDNDPMKWPYNWENFQKSGAPKCEWDIVDDKLYLAGIKLVTGTGFYEAPSIDVPLEEVFNHLENDKVFADWLSGIFIMKHGKEEKDTLLPAFEEFKVTGLTYMRIAKGMVLEKYTVPADFGQKGVIPEDTEPGLKKMLEELK